jgi:hypothetical protein
MKTTNNCYVAQKNLYSKPDITYLDPCGPVPFLEFANHNNENGTSDVNKRDTEHPRLPNLAERSAKYLENVTIGEEYSYCHSCAADPCDVKKRYEFNQEVWIQCLVNTNSTWWSQTTVGCEMSVNTGWPNALLCRTFVTLRIRICGKPRKAIVSFSYGTSTCKTRG